MIGCLFAARGASATSWENAKGYRVMRLQVPTNGQSGFTLLGPEQTGILFTNRVSYERSLTNQALLEGAGICAGDFDGDGLPDLYFCNLEGPNALFRNLGGFRFANVAVGAGVTCSNQISRGAVFADVNGDGWLDLLVTSTTGPNACLFNDGHGHFRDVTQEAGLTSRDAGCTSLALADVDGDGALDLYIAATGINTLGGAIAFKTVNGKTVLSGRAALNYKLIEGVIVPKGSGGLLFRNDGKGRFRPVSWTDGAFLTEEGTPLKEPPLGMGLSVMFRDINGDGLPDIYLCNDWEAPDRIWINDGKGHFRALPDHAIRKTSLFSMSVDFADINRDGFDDLFNADMISRFRSLRLSQLGGTNPAPAFVGELRDRQQARRNTLQLNRGDGTYAEIANYAGVAASDWTWCVAFLDVDLDGYEDLLVANGHLYDLQDRDTMEKTRSTANPQWGVRSASPLKNYPPLPTPNYLFRNRGNCTFEETGAAWGFNSTNACHGISLVDLDNDGDLDVVVSCQGRPPLVYRNDSTAPRVAVRLRGKAPNTYGIGAKITLRGGAVPEQGQEMQCGGRYLSSDQPMRTFAAGSLTNRMTLEVRWRGSGVSIVTNVEANCLYEVDEVGASTPPTAPDSVTTSCLFEDVSASLRHRHLDPPWDDFSRQKLLPRRLSQLGPAVAWFDLDGDGRDDLVIGAGRGTAPAFFLNHGPLPWPQLAGNITNSLPDDSAGIVGGVLKSGVRSLLLGLAHYESEATNSPAALRLDRSQAGDQISALTPLGGASPGPMALADLRGHGRLDLFVGGRLIAGEYPAAADSVMFTNRDGQLLPDPSLTPLFSKAGLITGAVFADLDGDGFPELVLACEWGPIRIFKNNQGRLQEWNAPLVNTVAASPGLPPVLPTGVKTLSEFLGRWSCLATGDFDGDGLMDIVAGNWGLNTAYQPVAPGPWFLYYGDFNDDGLVHIFEAYHSPDSGDIVPFRDLSFMEADLPWLRTVFPTHEAYSKATLPQILGERITKAHRVEALVLHSVLLLNRRDKFEVRPLPAEVQWSPAMGLTIGDLDGDGYEDLFVSQNYFAVRPGDERCDAGRGVYLKGDGHGGFAAVAGQRSGLLIYGEQRGCALADYDGDGRVDLVVAQNNAETRLFHNLGAKRGLRVRLGGPPGNPEGIGAVLRLESQGGLGPAREVQAGTGCGSQNSAIQVLASPTVPTGIQVRWPGGKTVRSQLPAAALEVLVSMDGTVRMLH
jgi:enediyne biosynthesis protein E4